MHNNLKIHLPYTYLFSPEHDIGSHMQFTVHGIVGMFWWLKIQNVKRCNSSNFLLVQALLLELAVLACKQVIVNWKCKLPSFCTVDCVYNGALFKEGESWADGCDLTCTCEDAEKGYYRCNDRCVWVLIQISTFNINFLQWDEYFLKVSDFYQLNFSSRYFDILARI